MKPESSVGGNMKAKAPSIACCCEELRVAMRIPMSKMRLPSRRMARTSIRPKRMYGRHLPASKTDGRIGVTRICSRDGMVSRRSWQSMLEGIARGAYRILRDHPNWTPLLAHDGGLPSSGFGFINDLWESMLKEGFAVEDAMRAYGCVMSFAVGSVLFAGTIREPCFRGGQGRPLALGRHLRTRNPFAADRRRGQLRTTAAAVGTAARTPSPSLRAYYTKYASCTERRAECEAECFIVAFRQNFTSSSKEPLGTARALPDAGRETP